MDAATNPWAGRREEYVAAGLSESDLTPEPFALFRRWYAEVEALPEPNAMVVATVSAQGQPSARTVLLKGMDERGFVFFTNQTSRKGRDLAANPRCALLFPWHVVQRQVRVEGTAEPLPRSEVEEYFATRPRGAQLGAWASPQSQPATLTALDDAYAAADATYPKDVPTPPSWGGYRVAPETVEFWQGRRNRMHDRLRYRWTADGWEVDRLAP